MQTGERVRVQARSSGARATGSRDAARDARARQEEAERDERAAREAAVPLERIALTAIAADGAPLRPDVRADLEAGLGTDFGAVRIHTGDVAARAARLLGAEAFTVGEDVVFGAGMYAPDDAAGRHRLAHELAHVVQQRRGLAGAAVWGVSRAGDALEEAAERAAVEAARGAGAPASEYAAHDAVRGAGAPASEYAANDAVRGVVADGQRAGAMPSAAERAAPDTLLRLVHSAGGWQPSAPSSAPSSATSAEPESLPASDLAPAADGHQNSAVSPAAPASDASFAKHPAPAPAPAPSPAAARSTHPRVIQRRALLDLSPAREAASDAAADSPWLGMTAPGMLDFTGLTPKLSPTGAESASNDKDIDNEADQDTDTSAADRGDAPAPAAPTRPDLPEPEGSKLDPAAVPEHDPEPPAPSPPSAPAPPDHQAAAKASVQTDAKAVAETKADFPGAKEAEAHPSSDHTATASGDHAATTADHEAPGAATGNTPGNQPAAPGATSADPKRTPADRTVPLQLPKFPDKTAEEFATLVAADRDGQLRLKAAVDKALADIAGNLDKESGHVDEGVKTAEATIAEAVKKARGQVQGAAAVARKKVEQARSDQGDRATKQLTTKKNAVPTDVEQIAKDVEGVGTKKADAAKKLADSAATDVEGIRDSSQKQARKAGDDKAGTAASYDEEPEIRRASVGAQQNAAHDIAEQTAKAIGDALDAGVKDWRSGDAKTRTELAAKLAPIAKDVRDQIDPMKQAMTAAGTQLTTGLDDAVTNTRKEIEKTARGLMNALAAIERQTKRQLSDAADTTKAGLRKARTDAEQQLHGKQTEFVTAAHTELGQKLALISSRPVRRMLARRLANELRAVLRDGYGVGVQQSNQLAGRIAAQLSELLKQFHEGLTAATEPAKSGAESTAKSGATQLAQLQKQVVDALSKAVTDTLTQADQKQSERVAKLGETVGAVDDKLVPFLDQTRTTVDGDKQKLKDDVRDKLGSLDGRLDQAMSKAREKAELGAFGAWLLDQVRSLGKAMLTPSFWVGLLVGLAITIFIVATFGSGAVVLVIAGAIAGAIAAAASYTAQCYLDPLVDPSAPKKSFSAKELGYQMLIGGIAGGVGAAAGGLATAGVNAIVSNVASRVVVNKVAQTVVGAALGVVQNVLTGEDGHLQWELNTKHWDEGLLTNIAVSTAMSSKHVEERIGKIQGKARDVMVDKGLAKNITPEEHAQAVGRLEAKSAAPGGEAGPRTTAVPDLSGVKVDTGPASPKGVPGEPAVPAVPVPTAPAEHAPAVPAAPAEHVPALPPPAEHAPTAPPSDHGAAAPPPAEHVPAPPAPPAEHVTAKPSPPAEHVEAPRPPGATEGLPAAPKPSAEHAPPGPRAPEKEAAAVRTPEHEGGAPGAPREEHAPGARPEADLTDMVISGETPMHEAEARNLYERARDQEPHNEFAILKNSETGEHIIIQGDNKRTNWHESFNSSMREFLQDRPGQTGRWDIIEHSHPVDPTRGVTPNADRYPSGRGGDYSYAEYESHVRGGAAVEQKIGIVTERGKETVHFGFDPGHEKPYSLLYPGPDGRPVTERFASMEKYGEWYANQPGTGGSPPHIDRPGSGAVGTPRGGATKPPPVPKSGKRSAGAPVPPVEVPKVELPPAPPAEHAGAAPRKPGAEPAGIAPPLPPAVEQGGVVPGVAGAEHGAAGAPVGAGAGAAAAPVVEHAGAGAPAAGVEHGPAAPPPASVAEHAVPGAPAAGVEHAVPAPPAEHAAATPPPTSEHAAVPTATAAPADHPAAAPAHPAEHPAERTAAPAGSAAATDHPAAPPTTTTAPDTAAVAAAKKPKSPTESYLESTAQPRTPGGQFGNKPSTGNVFLPELGETVPHTMSAKRAEAHAAQVAKRNEAKVPLAAAEDHVAKLAGKAGVDPEKLIGSKQAETLNDLRKKGVPKDQIDALVKAEAARAKAADNLVRESERIGMIAGEDFLDKGGYTKISGDTEGRGTPGTADLIGVSEDGKKLHVVEAKGGSAGPGPGRKLPEGQAKQGSLTYLEDLLHRDPAFRKYLEDHPQFHEDLRSGKVQIDYTMVSARADGSVAATPFKLVPEPSPATPVGGSGGVGSFPVPEGGSRNTRAMIGVSGEAKSGRMYTGPALDQMQAGGLVPAVVEGTIRSGEQTPGPRKGTTVAHDPVNNVTVVYDTAGQVLEVRRGPK